MTLPQDPEQTMVEAPVNQAPPVEETVVETVEVTETVEEQPLRELSEEECDREDDAGYEPNVAVESDTVTEADELPAGDSGEFDGSVIDDNEAPGVAQPDEPMTREAETQEQE